MLPFANPLLLGLGALEVLGNVRDNVAERCGLARIPKLPEDLTGQVYIVTGANAGVGKATVEALALRGAHVVMAVRSLDRGNKAAQDVRDSVQRAAAGGVDRGQPSIEVLPLDLGSLSSVRRFASSWNSSGPPTSSSSPHPPDDAPRLNAASGGVTRRRTVVAATAAKGRGQGIASSGGAVDVGGSGGKRQRGAARRLDVLVCNAGLMAPPRRGETEDGFEEQFQVNYLGHWLLATQLAEGQIRRERSSGSSSSNGSTPSSASPPPPPSTSTTVATAAAAALHGTTTNTSAANDTSGAGNASRATGGGAAGSGGGVDFPAAAAAGWAATGGGEAVGGGKEGGGLRVVFVSSMTHFGGGPLRWHDLQWRFPPGCYRPFQAYCDSKLMDVLAAKEMQRRFDRLAQRQATPSGPCMTAVAVHPGIVNTSLAWGFFGNAAGPLQPLVNGLRRCVASLVTRPPRAAAETVLFAATAPADEVAGGYVAGIGRLEVSSKLSHDKALADRLWAESCKLTGFEPDDL